MLERSKQDTCSRFALLFLDLDGFKEINDNYGHQIGDQLLQVVAKRFVSCVRESDTVARMGGDEFIILLNDLHHREEGDLVARKLLLVCSAPFHLGEVECRIGVSIGIAIFPENAELANELISRADSAMYEAKRAGKNTFRYSSRNQ